MINIIAQIYGFKWGINMVDTAQIDHIGLDAKPTIDKLKKEAHKSNLWQHNNLPLIFVA